MAMLIAFYKQASAQCGLRHHASRVEIDLHLMRKDSHLVR